MFLIPINYSEAITATTFATSAGKTATMATYAVTITITIVTYAVTDVSVQYSLKPYHTCHVVVTVNTASRKLILLYCYI